ncbi:DNA polymerase III, delta subunit [Nitrosococcus halophilus Nc 4]|uniref:DNA polymerase III subunit delta n=1 Tax=Nitrosococcus halophilus (strain Nc4) TaxID=472759 RepID=D5BW73_NITHN|nr:DNA polymerase III subunit delta [Nitrosococcus halophilus]ADE13723.1 DNA polymerase III, delta subunit [Nitrosococcus halophilus Nc 4]
MRVKLEQLAAHLERKIAPIYLLFGDEPLLIEEAADLIRAQARSQGFNEREVMHVDRGFDWGQLQLATESLSLFASRRLLELRLSGGGVGEPGAKALQAYGKDPSRDTLLLIISNKLERRHQGSSWFSLLEQAGVVVQVFKVDPSLLPRWIERRMQSKNLHPTPEAVTALAERLEGNLLACAQEIDKLALLCPEGTIDIHGVEEVVADSARYDAFRLVESALAGDVVRISRIWRGLRAEGVDPSVVLGALAWELRRLVRVATACAQGTPVDQALREERVWERRKALSKQALSRHAAYRWRIFLQRLSDIDRMIKGAAKGRPWEAILQLCIAIAGVELFPPCRGNLGYELDRA